MSRMSDIEYIFEQNAKHTELFRNGLPMIASENLISPLAQAMLVSDFHNRYAEGNPGARYYQGNEFVDNVERKAMELAQELFQAEYADVRPISATVANLGILFGTCKPGDAITTCDVSSGGHISTAPYGAVGVRGLNRVTYPFDLEEMNIDVDATISTILAAKPKVCLFGMSVFLFPTPIKELQDAIQEVGATAWYDGAHVLGLIAGGEFQDPLREGCEILSGSTHKTLPGPQRGMIVANPKSAGLRKSLNSGIFPGVLSNHHLHTMAALAITLAEHIEFGKAYASQVIRNARTLGQALHERGFTLLGEKNGFTRSHTLAMDVSMHMGGKEAVEKLEMAGVITNKNLLPWDSTERAQNPSGIRVGSQELTRIGMGESEMIEIADIFKDIIIDGKDPAIVSGRVRELRENFTTIQYCYHDNVEAHRFFDMREKFTYSGFHGGKKLNIQKPLTTQGSNRGIKNGSFVQQKKRV